MDTATAASTYMHPVNVSARNQYATARSSVSRFDTEFLANYVVPRERARNREVRAERTLRPADLVYLRACLDELEDRGAGALVEVA
jgi:hypothetical protein